MINVNLLHNVYVFKFFRFELPRIVYVDWYTDNFKISLNTIIKINEQLFCD